MKARKLAVTALAMGLVVGSLGVAEAAKKKKKPKPVPAPVAVDQTFYMRRDACTGAGADSADNARLSLEDGVDEGNLCGWGESGLLNEAVINSGQLDAVADVWPVADGLPLTVDATKPISGKLQMVSSFLGAAPDNGLAGGNVEIVIDFTGVSGGEDVVLGTATAEYQVTPASSRYEVPFEIKLDGALDKKSFESLVMTTTIRGANFGHGLYELDQPASTVVIPSWVVR